MRWLLLLLIFVFIFVGIEIYCHTQLLKSDYATQSLQSEIEEIEKENALLEKGILSWKEREDYAREKLNLAEPQEVRYIKEFH